MNGSEGEAAGLLPAQQKPKRVRRRKSREQVIQPIAVDLQAVPPEQAPGVLGLEVPLPPVFSLQSIDSHCSSAHIEAAGKAVSPHARAHNMIFCCWVCML